MADSGKRKGAPAGDAANQRSKKKRTGNAGKWKTPHQQAKTARHQEENVQPGDVGVWVTCARHQEAKAAREVGLLFAEYAEKMYGIKPVQDTVKPEVAGGDDASAADNDDDEDIEAAIRKEVAALTSKPSSDAAGGAPSNLMKPMRMNVDCLLFVKTPTPPIDPVSFVRQICEDARACHEKPGLMRCRYVNRLTPVSVTGKANEQGLVEVAREVLGPWFDLSGKRGGGDATTTEKAAEAQPAGDDAGEKVAPAAVASTETEGGSGNEQVPASALEKKPFTFAIRPSIRNHSNLKRDVVINTIAGMINEDRHKVNLTSPDKVILIDIYQTVVGMSVVDGDWDALKRFNLTELYSQATQARADVAGGDADAEGPKQD